MRNLFLFVFILGATQFVAFSANAGKEGVGGGDLCENRIKIIRDDLKLWINNGGPQNLQLLQGVSVGQYSKAMLDQIDSAKIRCVGQGDVGYPVNVDGTAKVCRFDKTAQQSLITCDFNKFNSMGESDQYMLIHHEYAGLSDLEKPKGDSSTYFISNQITSYLEDQVVKRLVVKSVPVVREGEFTPIGRGERKAVTIPNESSLEILETKLVQANMGSLQIGEICELRFPVSTQDRSISAGYTLLLAHDSTRAPYWPYEVASLSPSFSKLKCRSIGGTGAPTIAELDTSLMSDHVKLKIAPPTFLDESGVTSALSENSTMENARDLRTIPLGSIVLLPKGFVIPAGTKEMALVKERICTLVVKPRSYDRILSRPLKLSVSSVFDRILTLSGSSEILELGPVGDQEGLYREASTATHWVTRELYTRPWIYTIGELKKCLRAVGGDFIMNEPVPF